MVIWLSCEGDLGLGAVGDGVEGVAGAEGTEFGELLTICWSSAMVEGSRRLVGVVGEFAGPVGAGFGGGVLGMRRSGRESCRSRGLLMS